MIVPVLYTVKGKLLLGLVAISTTLLAAGEANNNQTLIVVAAINLFGTFVLGVVTIVGARISAGNRAGIAEQKKGLEELSKGIDGVAHELKAATAEGNLAKVDAALLEGQLKERDAETARKGAEALAQQAAPPAPVIVKNTEEDRVKVKL